VCLRAVAACSGMSEGRRLPLRTKGYAIYTASVTGNGLILYRPRSLREKRGGSALPETDKKEF
jgi:hypothetical protein